MKEKEQINFFRPVSSLIGKTFIVKDYQRGYKWESKEILELLNDFNEHSENDGKYCLQPVIVRENEDGSLELIDGQQRITSLYLLLVFLKKSNNDIYYISYETRTESKEFLFHKIIELNQYVETGLKWEEFIAIDGFEKYDNVDIYHFYTVYKTIHDWFIEKDEDFKINFLEKVLNIVHVIWYDIDKSQNNTSIDVSAEEVFLNLNAGKIALTSSELIKALFILECKNNNSKEIYKLKATELALEWDQIENKLHDNSFWFFICDNDLYNDSSTKIDYIFDIVNKRGVKDGVLHSYCVYEKRFRLKEDLNWLEVKNTFNKLLEWYEDKDLYHYVGFLIVSKIKSLSSIITMSKGISKSDFKKKLLKSIDKEFEKTRKQESGSDYYVYQLENLDYRDSRKECENLLILLNINYYINNLSDNKFPFELYKLEKWSVEHINPQNPREFDNVGSIKNWLLSNKEYFTKQNKSLSISKQIEIVLIYFDKIDINDKRKLSELKFDKTKTTKLEELIEAISNELNLHGISNLALLDRNSNSKLGNKLFLEKREIILKLDQDGKYMDSKNNEKKVFIPICTKNVFSKIYTTDKNSVANSFFGKSDMDSYFEFIENQLKSFLPNLKGA
ncbi:MULTISPECIES: DUF262 domain-containing protein [Flavobacterium]|uniref:DUF262 domain-containing protein n=1 Tax=Flavobacterium jumunjinense TaxID=998845 RepID=A0ABV5GLF3_9FLAO|nr:MULTISPECIES: DUF262 domain-containing protein [Flavobacterium]